MCETLIHTNAKKITAQQYDPTHTLTLRNAFVSEMNRRFKRISKAVTKVVGEDDVFGLDTTNFEIMASYPSRRAFAFMTDSQKLTAFLNWLRQVEDAVLLEMQLSSAYGSLAQIPWFASYVAKAYQQGTDRAKQEMKKAGLTTVLGDSTGVLYINPVSVQKLMMLFTRSFNDLKGITTTMDEHISRILAQGLLDGRGPMELARMINTAIIGGGESLGMDISYINKAGNQVTYFMPGRRRAEILARTEIIRAHHKATIDEYRTWGIEGVYVLAEWATAGDDRVCVQCGALQGTKWTLDEIEGMIPAHPQCRCVSIPFVDKTRTKVGGE